MASSAVCKQQCATATQHSIDAAAPIRFASSELQKATVHDARSNAEQMWRSHANPHYRSQWNYIDKTEVSPGQSLLQNRISAPKLKEIQVWSLFKRTVNREVFKRSKDQKKVTVKLSAATNTHFAKDIPQTLIADDVTTQFACKTSLKSWQLQMWRRNFCARLPSKV